MGRLLEGVGDGRVGCRRRSGEVDGAQLRVVDDEGQRAVDAVLAEPTEPFEQRGRDQRVDELQGVAAAGHEARPGGADQLGGDVPVGARRRQDGVIRAAEHGGVLQHVDGRRWQGFDLAVVAADDRARQLVDATAGGHVVGQQRGVQRVASREPGDAGDHRLRQATTDPLTEQLVRRATDRAPAAARGSRRG